MALERAVMDAGSSSDEGDGTAELAFIPRFANADAGLAMELALAKEARERELEDGTGGGCIVDQTQFRNTEVGKGYQHKTVVRQRTGQEQGRPLRVVDMSKPSSGAPDKDKHSDKRGGGDRKHGSSHKSSSKKHGKHDKKRRKHSSHSAAAASSDSEAEGSGAKARTVEPSLKAARPALEELRCLLELKLRKRGCAAVAADAGE